MYFYESYRFTVNERKFAMYIFKKRKTCHALFTETGARAAHHQPGHVPEPTTGGRALQPLPGALLLGEPGPHSAAHPALALSGVCWQCLLLTKSFQNRIRQVNRHHCGGKN